MTGFESNFTEHFVKVESRGGGRSHDEKWVKLFFISRSAEAADFNESQHKSDCGWVGSYVDMGIPAEPITFIVDWRQ